MKKFLSTAISALILFAPSVRAEENSSAIHWVKWSDDIFKTAEAEKKLVVLDLEAVWCHGCHVMDEKTYSNAKVIELLNKNFMAVKVDQDSRPDLANRYEEYGWPATIIYNSKGEELVKRSGYMSPEAFASLLEAVVKDPTPGPSVVAEKKLSTPTMTALSDDMKKNLRQKYVELYDKKNGGWGGPQKFMAPDYAELALVGAHANNKQDEKMLKETLTLQMKLLDPAWGGVYQYSTDNSWTKPHFEKIMQMQAENIRIYSMAYEQYKDPRYLHMATEISRFLADFLTSPEGAFYTSMDADLVQGEHSAAYFQLNDQDRRKKGIPRVDQHIYSRENGWAIAALASLYSATGNEDYRMRAEKAALWILKNRKISGGGFSHDEKDSYGPYLSDTLAMGQGFLALYTATGDRTYLHHAEEAAQFIHNHFIYKVDGKPAGFTTVAASNSKNFEAKPLRDENIAMARFTNLLSQYAGKIQYRKWAEVAMMYLSIPEVANQMGSAGTLLADYELQTPPVHLTIVGAKNDSTAAALFKAANAYPSTFKRIEWWDKKEGNLPNPDVQYPQLDKPAAFACSDKRCSSPIFNPNELRLKVDKLTNATSVVLRPEAHTSR